MKGSERQGSWHALHRHYPLRACRPSPGPTRAYLRERQGCRVRVRVWVRVRCRVRVWCRVRARVILGPGLGAGVGPGVGSGVGSGSGFGLGLSERDTGLQGYLSLLVANTISCLANVVLQQLVKRSSWVRPNPNPNSNLPVTYL